MERILRAEENHSGMRLDVFVASALPSISRSSAQKAIEAGGARMGNRVLPKNFRVSPGDEILLTIPDPLPCEVEPEHIDLKVVYEDDDVIVVDKPRGMVVHPAAGNRTGTLVNALLAHCGGSLSGINGVIRPGIVHRIDKDTSGLLVAAKNDRAHLALAAQIKEHSFTRIYEAICCGSPKEDSGTVDAPIGRNPRDRKKMAVGGICPRRALTHYEVIARYRGYTHIRCRLETGRTHQIRVHMAHLGHPLLGDKLYGAPRNPFGFEGQCLFAKTIGFIHPTTGRRLVFEADTPAYFRALLERLNALEE